MVTEFPEEKYIKPVLSWMKKIMKFSLSFFEKPNLIKILSMNFSK